MTIFADFVTRVVMTIPWWLASFPADRVEVTLVRLAAGGDVELEGTEAAIADALVRNRYADVDRSDTTTIHGNVVAFRAQGTSLLDLGHYLLRNLSTP